MTSSTLPLKSTPKNFLSAFRVISLFNLNYLCSNLESIGKKHLNYSLFLTLIFMNYFIDKFIIFNVKVFIDYEESDFIKVK